MRFKAAIAIACGAMLMLGACTGDVKVGGGDPGELKEAEERAAAAEAARDAAKTALTDLQESLARLNVATTPEQRAAVRTAVATAQRNLTEVQQELERQPNSAAKTAVTTALVEVNTALGRVSEALGATNTALGSGGGPVSFASMHTSLDRAQAALDTAQTELGKARRALEANPDAALSTLLAQAQATLTIAQVSLVPLLREELADARTRASEAAAERDALREEHVSPPLFGTIVPRTLGATIAITRTPRTVPSDDGMTWVANPNALEIATDAVPYREGVTLLSRAGTEEFPMREITFRGNIRQGSQRGRFSADADNQGRFPIVQGPLNTLGNVNDHTKKPVISSIQLSEDGGLILKAGGSGVVFNEFQWDIRGTEADGPDGIPGTYGGNPGNGGEVRVGDPVIAFHVAMYRNAGETEELTVGAPLTQAQVDKLNGWADDNCSGVTFPCWDGNMRDLTIDFGTPSPDPDGEAGYYWESLIPSSPDQPKPGADDAMHRWATGKVGNFVDPNRGNGEYRGEYRLWLSNYAGLDLGEEADDASDDAHRYLQYAAYGLFAFTDYLTSNRLPARLQGFHFGYDAFMNVNGMKTTDLDTPITATFAGRTAAMVMEPHSDRSQVERLIRVRADVELNAVIGGANTIRGEITNFWTPSGRSWSPYAPLERVELKNGTIEANGSYAGETDETGGPSHLWDDGKFGGNFYGPVSDLETAGWWYLLPRGYTPPTDGSTVLTGADARDYPGRPDFRYSGVFGSFGAACTEGCE